MGTSSSSAPPRTRRRRRNSSSQFFRPRVGHAIVTGMHAREQSAAAHLGPRGYRRAEGNEAAVEQRTSPTLGRGDEYLMASRRDVARVLTVCSSNRCLPWPATRAAKQAANNRQRRRMRSAAIVRARFHSGLQIMLVVPAVLGD